MMVAVVVIFGLCWLPYHTYFIVVQMHESIRHTPYIQQIYLLIYWLAMSNSLYNPIIYCLMNARSVHFLWPVALPLGVTGGRLMV